jgi:hypothetical protein
MTLKIHNTGWRYRGREHLKVYRACPLIASLRLWRWHVKLWR